MGSPAILEMVPVLRFLFGKKSVNEKEQPGRNAIPGSCQILCVIQEFDIFPMC